MNRQTKLYFEKSKFKNASVFGGAHLGKSHAKVQRPISTKSPMHVVLRSSLAKGKRSFLSSDNTKLVDVILKSQSYRWRVKIYRKSINGNHLHLLVLPSSRQDFVGFIRSISGLIARAALGAERGSALNLKFWDQRPFSRIVQWGQDFKVVVRYINLNILESVGFAGLLINPQSDFG